jgi:hypothetical protein
MTHFITYPMRRTYLITLLMLLSCVAFAQTNSVTLPRHNLFNDSRFYIESRMVNSFDLSFKVVFQGPPQVEREFTLTPFKIESFKTSLINNLSDMAKAVPDDEKKIIIDNINNEQLYKDLFLYIQSSAIASSNIDTRPDAGVIQFNQVIDIHCIGANQSPLADSYRKMFTVRKITKNDGTQVSDKKQRRKHFVVESKSLNINEKYRTHPEAISRIDYYVESKIQHKLEQQLTKIDQEIDEIGAKIKVGESEISGLKVERSGLFDKQTADTKTSIAIDSLSAILTEKHNLMNGLTKEVEYELQPIANNDYSIKFRNKWRKNPKPTDTFDLTPQRMIANARIRIDFLKMQKDEMEKLLPIVQKIKENNVLGKKNGTGLTEAEFIFCTTLKFSNGIDDSLKTRAKIDSLNRAGIDFIEGWIFNAKEIEKVETEASNLIIAAIPEYLDMLSKLATLKAKIFDPTQLQRRLVEISNSLTPLEANFVQNLKNFDDKVLEHRKIVDQMPIRQLKIGHVTVEFNQGFIENILVNGTLDEEFDVKAIPSSQTALQSKDGPKTIILTNVQPIGFSRKKDFSALQNFFLWTEGYSGGKRSQYSVCLGDIIEYYAQTHQLNRRDYSPADGTSDFDLSAKTQYTLKKAPTFQLIEAKAFTDFVGLAPESPNGLIQTEVGQKINLVTHRLGIRWRAKGGIFGNHQAMLFRQNVYANYGIFGYIHPSLTISKIENKERSLLLSSRDLTVNNTYFQERFASTLQLRNYENLNTGFDLNVLTIDLPFFKSTFYGDMGFRFGRTQVIDSVRALVNGVPQNTGKGSKFGVNTFRWYPKVTWEIKPEERYGFSSSVYWNSYYLWDTEVRQVGEPNLYMHTGFDRRSPRHYTTIELMSYFNPSPDNPTGKLFFRYTFNSMGLRWNTNFHQAQVGYSFYLLGRSKK